MSSPASTQSFWVGTTPSTNYPQLTERLSADVVVVGGGITGITCAALLADAGIRVVLLEGRRLATGTTGNTTAKVTALQGVRYADLLSSIGEERSRQYVEANVAGLEEIVSLVARYGLDCDLRRSPAYTYTEHPDHVEQIEREVDAAGRLGLRVSLVHETPLPFPIAAAVRCEDQALFHPRRYCLGLAAALSDHGVQIFEQSRALRVDEDGARLRVITQAGEVDTEYVVIATLLPFQDPAGFFARTYPSRSYALAATLPGPLPDGMFLGIDEPTRSVRPHVAEGEGVLIIEGEEHKTGEDADTRRRYDAVETWAQERLAPTSVEYRWSAQDYMTPDRVPYVGRMGVGSDRVLVATGFNKWGMTNGTAAAIMLSNQVLGRDNPWLPAFDSTRLPPGSSIGTLIRENLDVARRYIGDRLGAIVPEHLSDLAPGEAAVVGRGDERVAAYRDPDGTVHTVSPVCTHMGCYVHWNTAERSWDCPCHGSRFTFTGEVIEGPATVDLEIRTADPAAG